MCLPLYMRNVSVFKSISSAHIQRWWCSLLFFFFFFDFVSSLSIFYFWFVVALIFLCVVALLTSLPMRCDFPTKNSGTELHQFPFNLSLHHSLSLCSIYLPRSRMCIIWFFLFYFISLCLAFNIFQACLSCD